MLGMDLVSAARASDHEVCYVEGLDITDKHSIYTGIMQTRPDLIINSAAYTDVDGCESNREKAFKVNGEGPGNIGEVASHYGLPVVHFSTDYVFRGESALPYTEDSEPDPVSVYGASKLDGERRLMSSTDRFYILRISWLYGYPGNNFVKTILGLARERDSIRVVDDQIGSPTWTVDVCNQVLKLIETEEYGLYHCTSHGSCSWYDFASYILGVYGIDCNVESCTTDEFPRPALRPSYSFLENGNLRSLGIDVMPHWRDGFDSFSRFFSI